MSWLCNIICATAVVAAQGSVAKDLYKCAAPSGGVTFSDRPCPLPPGTRAPDPVPGASAPRGGGELSAAERKAIVDKMNAEISKGIVKREEELARQAAAETARSKPTSSSQPMRFEACRALVARSLLSVAGATKTFTIVNTSALTIHKICTIDGSVILTCSADEERLVTTASPYPCP